MSGEPHETDLPGAEEAGTRYWSEPPLAADSPDGDNPDQTEPDHTSRKGCLFCERINPKYPCPYHGT